MKATALAPANIAFIKYWGKKNERLRIPANNSLSMNLSAVSTTTTVEFNPRLKSDQVIINRQAVSGIEHERVVTHLNRVRRLAKVKTPAKVTSANNFPAAAGIASSASAFAALSLAATKAAGLALSQRELSVLARLGSGSACRSIPDGFVEWKAGTSNNTSYAVSLYPPDYWDLVNVIAILGEKPKKVSSTEGHARAESSPFYHSRIRQMPLKIAALKQALNAKDFTKFGEIIEAEAINMHAVMMTSDPPLYYWLPTTLGLIHQVIDWRAKGLEIYFTIDAGPNLHLICQSHALPRLHQKLNKLNYVEKAITNYPSLGARLLDQVILVNPSDRPLGYLEKFEAHQPPFPLHRALSVIITDGRRMLLQRRARTKPTWPLFWSNACCTHPRKGESAVSAAHRRLREELGFTVPLTPKFRFVYQARYNHLWGEHELDHVFVGQYSGPVKPDPREVAEFKWVELKALKKDLAQNPQRYTPWFHLIFKKLYL